MTEAPTLAEVEQFLYREVRLLDERRFEDWMALYTDDGVYWVPTAHDQKTPEEAVSIFFDDRGTMRARIARLAHPDTHVQAPLSHTTHMVSNVELDLNAAPERGFRVLAAFLMTEHRRGEPRWYSGRYEYRLRRESDGLRIASKKAVLVNCTASFTAMAVYI